MNLNQVPDNLKTWTWKHWKDKIFLFPTQPRSSLYLIRNQRYDRNGLDAQKHSARPLSFARRPVAWFKNSTIGNGWVLLRVGKVRCGVRLFVRADLRSYYYWSWTVELNCRKPVNIFNVSQQHTTHTSNTCHLYFLWLHKLIQKHSHRYLLNYYVQVRIFLHFSLSLCLAAPTPSERKFGSGGARQLSMEIY